MKASSLHNSPSQSAKILQAKLAVGKSVDQFAVGDRVFGFAEGAQAEYAAASPSGVSRMPDSVRSLQQSLLGVR